MAESKQRTPSTRSPLAGCTIIFVGIGAMVFLVAFVIWNLFKLDKEISKFTTPDAVPTPVADLVENVTGYNDLKSRLELFKDAAGNAQDATLELSAADINLIIAAFDEFKELRKTFSVTGISDDKLQIAISFPLRGKPLSEEMRYLNGTMIAAPKLAGDEIVLEIDRIEVPGAIVPEGFVGQMSPYRISQRYMEDPILGPWMRRLTAVSVQGERVVLTSTASELAREELPEDLSPFVNRFLLLSLACLVAFLLLIGALVLFLRRKRRAGEIPPEDSNPGE